MAQPSVAAYFNTRKRTIDDNKIYRAKKVLVVDSKEKKSASIDNSTVDIIFKAKGNSELSNRDNNKKICDVKLKETESKKSTPKSTKKKVVKECKGQLNLQNFLISLPKPLDTHSINSEKVQQTNIDLKSEDISREIKHVTPPNSPLKKKVNIMDKVSNNVETSKSSNKALNDVRMKLSRSSRLAELKAKISKFSESAQKLEEIEKVTSKIVVPSSPKLQSFKNIEVEVLLSPQKLLTPEKQYLSPKKDTTARKNLLNLLSPTKNVVALPQSPSKQINAESSRPALTLPVKYRYVAEMFRAIDTVCQLMFNRKETITFSKIKAAVEKMLKRNLTMKCLAQIIHVLPDAFSFKYEKIRSFGTSKFEEKWELIVVPDVKDKELINSEMLLQRRRQFFNNLLDKIKGYHEEFLLSLEPPMIISKEKITRWHPEFDIEKVPDIQEGSLPEAPVEQKFLSGKEVLEKAKEMFHCNERMEKALERLKETKKLEPPVQIKEEYPSILKGIPKALLEKVRQKQAAKALVSMTRSADKEKELLVYSRLPEIARLTRNLFVSEKKTVLPLNFVIDKLEHCYTVSLSRVEMEEHIKLIAKEIEGWLVLHNIRNTMFVKLDKKADLSVVLNTLENLTKYKSNC